MEFDSDVKTAEDLEFLKTLVCRNKPVFFKVSFKIIICFFSVSTTFLKEKDLNLAISIINEMAQTQSAEAVDLKELYAKNL